MTPKQIIYSDHASGRLRSRGITRQNVRWLLAQGNRTKAPTLSGVQRWECVGYLGHHEASVIFIEDATTILIVTVQWLS